jgi:DNA invertase Pin-like site-specific DNA recombinase
MVKQVLINGLHKVAEENVVRYWSRAEVREFIKAILKSERSVSEIAKGMGVSRSEIVRNGFSGISGYKNLCERLKAWKES